MLEVKQEGVKSHKHDSVIQCCSDLDLSGIRIKNLEELDEKLPDLCMSLLDTFGTQNLEATFQRALCIDLEMCGLTCEMEKSLSIMYKGRCVGSRRADIVITTEEKEQAAIELKAVRVLDSSAIKQMEYYLAHFNIDVGYLINFPHESGFPSVDSLGYLFDQLELSSPSNSNFPIMDSSRRSVFRTGQFDKPHIIKLKRIMTKEEHKKHQAQPPPTGGKSASDVRFDDFSQTRKYYGITLKGTPCKNCLKINDYCPQHLYQKK